MLDTIISTITDIQPHPNADKLLLAKVNNWQVIIPKDVYTEGQCVFFIAPDAMLPIESPWTEPYLNYLGKRGRVKTIKLRGEFSNGLILDIPTVQSVVDTFIKSTKPLSAMLKYYSVSHEIIGCKTEDDLDMYAEVLACVLNIEHYDPIKHSNGKAVLSGDALHVGLPYGVPKTDEENWQNMRAANLGLEQTCLITRKLDGSSCSATATPEGDFFVSSRNITFKDYAMNVYTTVMEQYKQQLVDYAKKHNIVIVVQGEITGYGVNASKVNIDCNHEPTFSLFGTIFPLERDIQNRLGWYGTDYHFLKVNEELNLPTVPVIGEEVITLELLNSYTNAPAENGEGIVIDVPLNGSYKVKSSDYYSKLK